MWRGLTGVLSIIAESGAQMPTLGSRQSSEHVEKGKTRPRWIDWCFFIGGLSCDWYLAFQWFSGTYSLFSATVLRAAALVVVLCALVSILAARIFGGKLRESAGAFFVTSAALLGNLLMWRTHP
jgi:hypothetical protein